MKHLYSSLSFINSKQIDVAIRRMETICSRSGQQILDCLQEYDSLAFIDLLIKTGLDQDQLRSKLNELVEAQIILVEDIYYTKEFKLNYPKLFRIHLLSKRIGLGLQLAA